MIVLIEVHKCLTNTRINRMKEKKKTKFGKAIILLNTPSHEILGNFDYIFLIN